MFNISTAVTEPQKFRVDGETEYEMYSMDHLTPEQEADVVATLSRFFSLSEELGMAGSKEKAKPIAEKIRTTRILLLSKLTNVPRAELEKWPLSAQAELLEAVQQNIDKVEEDTEATDES